MFGARPVLSYCSQIAERKALNQDPCGLPAPRLFWFARSSTYRVRKVAMKSRTMLAVCVSLLAVVVANSQERPAMTVQPNTVFAGAEGKFESAPDTALIQFNISVQEETSKAAYDRAARAADRVRQILKSNGIDPKIAELGFYSLDPVYDWRNPKRKLVGYRVSTSVSIRLKDFSKIGPLVQQFADVEGSENQSLSYILEKMDDAKQKAVQDALQRAKASAQTVAQTSGRTLGELVYASVDTSEPIPYVAARGMAGKVMMAAEAQPAPTAEFSAQKITVTARVNAMFGLK